jgi:hypothetical protein
MPMVDIVGVIRPFLWALDSSRVKIYLYILRDLYDIYRQLNLPDPRVVLTDKEKALMNAIKKIGCGLKIKEQPLRL